MKRSSLVVIVMAVVGLAAVAWAHDGHKAGKPAAKPEAKPAPTAAMVVDKVQLAGEIIDPQCWLTHYGEGADHIECAVRCAKGGQGLAFLDRKSGEVFTILAASHGSNPNTGLYEHVGVPVTVRGTTYRRGSNRGLMVEAVDKK